MPVQVETRWILPDVERAVVRSLSTGLGLPGIIAQMLATRGIRDVSAAREFLEGNHRTLSDPLSLTDMDVAVSRIAEARKRDQHVRVFGDYDVDGMTATALMTRGLRRFGLRNVSYALPDRLTEGYGINARSISQAARDGVDLIVTVDNGINAWDAADEAARLNLDLIITDHHSIDDRLPHARAVINPHRDDPDAPYAFACGCAVASMLCRALTNEDADLDLVALATVADVVALRRENRLLVARGLESIAARLHPGIEALVRRAKLNPREIRAEQIAFQLAPRLNASGRLGDGQAAISLLLSDSHGEAESLAAELDRLNLERRAIEDEILQQAMEMAEADNRPDRRIIVLAGRGWHPGVIGIVASRVLGAFGCPTVLIGIDEDGVGRGSGRSIADLHLADALSACSDLLVKHGGHRLAAGLTVRQEAIPDLALRLESAAAERMPATPSPREMNLDAVVALSEIDNALLGALDRLEPFGAENPPPVFGAFGVRVPQHTARALRGGHLQCRVHHEQRSFPAIGFGLADAWPPEEMPERVDIAFRPKFNTWRGETTIQLQLLGLRPSDAGR